MAGVQHNQRGLECSFLGGKWVEGTTSASQFSLKPTKKDEKMSQIRVSTLPGN